jgi:ribosomal protein L7/L12
MTLTKECVYLRGWKPGFNKVEFTKLMKAEVGVSLSAAKDLTDRLLAGETVIIWVKDLQRTIDQARSLGAVVLDYPRNKDAH